MLPSDIFVYALCDSDGSLRLGGRDIHILDSVGSPRWSGSGVHAIFRLLEWSERLREGIRCRLREEEDGAHVAVLQAHAGRASTCIGAEVLEGQAGTRPHWDSWVFLSWVSWQLRASIAWRWHWTPLRLCTVIPFAAAASTRINRGYAARASVPSLSAIRAPTTQSAPNEGNYAEAGGVRLFQFF